MARRLLGAGFPLDYAPNFRLRLMAKDLTYALGEGRQRGLSLATVALPWRS